MSIGGPESLQTEGWESLLALIHTEGGTAWRWAVTTEPDRLRALFEQSVVAGSIQLAWSATKGRHVVTCRDVQRGELLLRSHSLALVPLEPSGESGGRLRISQQAMDDMVALALDMATISLALSIWRDPEASAAARGLLSHAEHLTVAQCAALRRLVSELTPTSSAEEAGNGELTSLLLCVRSNAHRAFDDDTASKPIGLGLYPAASLVNHSCLPASSLSFANGGRELRLRAMVPLPKGAEVTYSYLADEQLYAPWAERASMLRAAHHFEPMEPPERRTAEQSAAGTRTKQRSSLSLQEEEAELERRLRNAVEQAQQVLHEYTPKGAELEGRAEPSMHRLDVPNADLAAHPRASRLIASQYGRHRPHPTPPHPGRQRVRGTCRH